MTQPTEAHAAQPSACVVQHKLSDPPQLHYLFRGGFADLNKPTEEAAHLAVQSSTFLLPLLWNFDPTLPLMPILHHLGLSCSLTDRLPKELSTDEGDVLALDAITKLQEKVRSRAAAVVVSFEEKLGAQVWDKCAPSTSDPDNTLFSLLLSARYFTGWMIDPNARAMAVNHPRKYFEDRRFLLTEEQASAAAAFSCRIATLHEFTHLFAATLQARHRPEKLSSQVYQAEPHKTRRAPDGTMLGERGILVEQMMLGGRLGAYFLGGKFQQWAYCAGLYISVWDEEKKITVDCVIKSEAIDLLNANFNNLTPSLVANYFEKEIKPFKIPVTRLSEVSSAQEQADWIAVPLAVESQSEGHGKSPSYELDKNEESQTITSSEEELLVRQTGGYHEPGDW